MSAAGNFFCSLARTPRLSARDRGPCFLAPDASQHFAWRPGLVLQDCACARYAAGYLHKQEVLTVTGPLRVHEKSTLFGQRHPSSLRPELPRARGSLPSSLFFYFAVFYSAVMRREAKELYLRHGASFEEYARNRPRFFLPRLTAAKLSEDSAGSFSFRPVQEES